VLDAITVGVAATAIVLVPCGVWIAKGTPGPLVELMGAVFIVLAFIPSLALLAAGVPAMVGGLRARRTAAHIADPVERQQMAAGMRLAWRIAWMSLLWSTYFSGVGYLVMYVIARLSG
jgi:hypothetical protein